MDGERTPGRVHERGDRVYIDRVIVLHLETHRVLHPRVGGHYEHARSRAADGYWYAAQPVGCRLEPVPAVEVETEEDSLQEEGVAFKREGGAYYWTCELHEGRPEQSKLEG